MPANRPPVSCAYLEPPGMPCALWLAWNDVGLTALQFCERGASAAATLEVPDASLPVSELPEPYRGMLDAYFAGKPVDPVQLPVDLSGTVFQRGVWSALRQVQRGHVRSYAGIAADVGNPRAMRAVGMANSRNPVAIVVPCHRIVQADMQLGGYSGGLHIKRYLLDLEGVTITGADVQPGQLELV
jgi:methylated-DNA-[protein]-cysteine S-methyltransferase